MAITHYIRDCKYAVGGLAKYIYLIPKDNLRINIKAKNQEVRVVNLSEDVYKIKASQCVYNQQETYEGRFRFQSTLEVTVSEQWEAPFFYGLKNLRENQYYIIIEDKQGIQYLVNPELFTSMTYEITFTDGNDEQDGVTLTFVNLSNHPLMIMDEKVTETRLLFDNYCKYNIGHSITLRMANHKDLQIQDDGVKVTSLNIDDYDKLKRVDFLPQSFEFVEHYDGEKFTTTLMFSIPLDDYQYYWSYDLVEFKDNIYKALVHTSNNNYIVLGNELGLFPSYKIATGEEDDEPNLVTFTFKQVSQYPSIYTSNTTLYKWVDDGELCFGFNKYAMWKKMKSTDFGKSWENTDPIEKKKGDLIEINSTECGYSNEKQWEETDNYTCFVQYIYEKWENTNEFICDANNKYKKTRKYVTTDSGKTWSATNEYGRGELIEECSNDCSAVAVRWIEDGNTYIEPDDKYTYSTSEMDGTICSGTTKMNVYKNNTYYSVNGVDYFKVDDPDTYEVNEIESCDCGYYYWDEDTSPTPVLEGCKVQVIHTDGTTTIDEFDNCKIPNMSKYSYANGIKEIIIGDGITEIEILSFSSCYDLTGLTIGNSVTSIGSFAFLGCDNLISIVIPSSVKEIGDYIMAVDEHPKQGTLYCDEEWFNNLSERDRLNLGAFAYWTRKPIESKPTPTPQGEYVCGSEIGLDEYSLYLKKSFYKFCKGQRVDPDETPRLEYTLVEEHSCECGYYTEGDWEEQDEYADGGDIGLTPGIKYQLFATYPYCEGKKLSNNPIKTKWVVVLDDCRVQRIYNGASITDEFDDCIIPYRQYDFEYKRIFFDRVIIGNGITSIGGSAFKNCTKLTSVTIGKSVTSIGRSAFDNCSKLTSITYNGTKSQFTSISKASYWKNQVPTYCRVHCTDGDYLISEFS